MIFDGRGCDYAICEACSVEPLEWGGGGEATSLFGEPTSIGLSVFCTNEVEMLKREALKC